MYIRRMTTPLVFHDLTEMARMVRQREVTSVALVDAHLAQIARHNATINAVVTLDAEGARARAREADAALARGESWGPLHGVPFTVKDTYATRGMRTSFASPELKDHVPDYDARLVERVKAAGGVLLGKTNLPTFAFDWQSSNSFYGRTKNPHDPGRVVGGSSGGSAAALAAGFTPLCLGSDAAGSIRVPAHFCGVAGIRPTEGALSDHGHLATPGVQRTGRELVACGPMARSIGDLRLAMAILWGPDRERWSIPEVPFEGSPEPDSLRGLRVAFAPTVAGAAVSRDTRSALESLIQRLGGAGAHVAEASPEGVDSDEAHRIWGALMAPSFVANAPWMIRATPLRGLGPLAFRQVFGKGRFGRDLGAGLSHGFREHYAALEARDRLIAGAAPFFEEHDVWITPVTSHVAFPHVKTGTPLDVDGAKVPYTEALSPFNCGTATLAHPVVVLRAGTSEEGLPIGVQLHGRRWRDARLLAIAALVEELLGRFPPPALVV